MMRCRSLVVALLLLPLMPGTAVPAEPPKIARIGLLGYGTREVESDRVNVLKEALAERGWEQGKTLDLEERYANADDLRLPALAIELAAREPHVLIGLSTGDVIALQAATRSIPIVFMLASDPVRSGLVESVGRPGGNTTGFSLGPQLLIEKQMELLIELLGRPRRIGFLVNPGSATTDSGWKFALDTARRLNVEVDRTEARKASDIEPAIESMRNVDGVRIAYDPLFLEQGRAIATVVARLRLPAIYGNRIHVVDGGLISYGADVRDNYRGGADYVDRILRGANPSELPIVQAKKFEMVINLRTAKALGIEIPQSILLRADEVIE